MALSPRLAAILEKLPIRAGDRVLEIGCGPGALARAIAERVGDGFVLGIDRSAKAIAQASGNSAGMEDRLAFRQCAIEEFELASGDDPFDLVLAVRVGVLDGRHPKAGQVAAARIAAVLAPRGRLFVDGREVQLTPSGSG